MPPLTDLENRITGSPAWQEAFSAAHQRSIEVAGKMYLTHGSNYKPKHGPARVPFLELLLGYGVIPTSEVHHNYSGHYARAAEEAMGWTPTVYFYAGRVHPSYGDVKLAFSTDDMPQPVRVAPFDTGGMVPYSGNSRSITPKGFTGTTFVVQAVNECGTDDWRTKMAVWLAAYFYPDPLNYFKAQRPAQLDPEQIYSASTTPQQGGDFFHERWTWEVHFDKSINILDHCVAWCMSNSLLCELRKRLADNHVSSDVIAKITKFLNKHPGGALLQDHGSPAEHLNEWIGDHACT